MRQGEPQASLRAMRNDHAELWTRSPFAVQSSPAACTAGAHEARALWAKQREVSPMKQGVPQASWRAQWNDHAELRGAWAHNTPRQKIPFSRAKIASLQFPRPKIRRILAETGRGARRPPPVAEAGRSKPNKQGRAASEPVSAAARPLRIEDVVVAGGARSARPVGETVRSKPNEQGNTASR